MSEFSRIILNAPITYYFKKKLDNVGWEKKCNLNLMDWRNVNLLLTMFSKVMMMMLIHKLYPIAFGLGCEKIETHNLKNVACCGNRKPATLSH